MFIKRGNKMDLKNKTILVFGSGKSGIAATVLLLKAGAVPVVYDGNGKLDQAEILKKIKCKANTDTNVKIILGELSEEIIKQLDMDVLSPGIPLEIPEVIKMKEAGIPIIGEIELAYITGKGRVFAITGTNGKTTSTTLLGEIMKAAYPEVYVVGNIGNPYTDVAFEQSENAVTVAEISSFQLETIDKFHANVAAITNLTEDHMNRHHTMEEYTRVKERITENQIADDTCVLNYEDEILREFGKTVKSKVIYFSSLHKLEKGIYYNDKKIIWADENGEIELVNTDDVQILGLHNFENIMTAAAMAIAGGVDIDIIRKVIKEFPGVAHRIEYVGEFDGVRYYNDSKGTNPDAAIKGIQAMDRPTLIIAGGYDKGGSFEAWINAFGGKVKKLVLIGQTKQKIADTAKACGFDEANIIMCEDLTEAVNVCKKESEKGDAILLSPACASWGQFDNYEQRGDVFKELVKSN